MRRWRRRLTDGTHPDSPDSGLSPDGRFVAFDRYSDQGSELWIMKSDGTQTRKVMSFGTCSLAVWAPKGALLAVTNLDDC
jgi:Tol biopolymer transport system component